MSAASTLAPPQIEYPEDDGEPLSDNTLQFRWIMTIQGGLDALFAQNPNVFVAGNLLWYPVEGNNAIRQAPDVMVAFGRPKGYRGSYRQWEEGGVPPQVLFEVMSPGNRAGELERKFGFYERYGVEEYYIVDPDRNGLAGFLRNGNDLLEIPAMNGWVSPRLKVQFELSGAGIYIYRPDGKPLSAYVELAEELQLERERAQLERESARQERDRLIAMLRAAGIDPGIK
jgi:Uma2 family endonuclease